MYFQIEKEADAQYRVRLMDENKIIMASEPLASRADALMCIRRVNRAAMNNDNFILWDIDSHKFNLYYGDGLLIGTIKYKSAANRDEALNLVRLAILNADVRDVTPELKQAA